MGRFDISVMFSMSGILPDRWKVCLDGGDISILSSDIILRSLIPFEFVFKHPHIVF